MSFFEELKRRNVVRVGIAYAVIGWVLAQIAEFAFENFGAPEWVLKTFVVALLLGLPIALFFAWAFEMTPEGIKLEKDVDRSASITRQTGRKLNHLIIIVLAVAVIGLVAERFVPRDDAPEPIAADIEQSIAVLPFVDLSPDQADDYFGKGIAEELLNALAQFPSLKVAARTSAFSFAGEDIDLREVGEALNVAHVLEGSIRRSGDRLRITAQLIRASDGFHLWSQTYERAMTDIFEIQDDIVRELTLMLQVRLGVGVGTSRSHQKGIDPRAYESYLQGLSLWSNRQKTSNRIQAIAAFRLATEIDETFADAWSAYALSLMHSNTDPSITSFPAEEWRDTVEGALSAALEADPDNARAHAGSALYYGRHLIDLERSRMHGDRAIELAPNSAATRYARSATAIVRGDYEEAGREMRQARLLDPLNIILARVQAQQNMIVGYPNDAKTFFEECLRTVCEGTTWSLFNQLEYSVFTGDMEAARAIVDRMVESAAADPNWRPSEQVNMDSIRLALNEDIEGLIELLGSSSFKAGSGVNVEGWALANSGHFDLAIRIMQKDQDEGGWFQYLQSIYNLSDGGYQFPTEFRKYKGYREFFEKNGLSELVRERIANGQTAGLPLNDDGSLVQF